MTTDITELAQILKAAANTTADAIDRLKEFSGDELIDLSQHEGEQVDIDITTINEWYELSSPANILALVEALEKAQQHIARQEQILLNQDESLYIRRGELEAAQQERENWRTSFDNERFRADKLKAHIDDIEPIRAAAEKLVRCKGRYHSEQNYRALAALFGVNTPYLPPLDGESRTVKLPDDAEHDIMAPVAAYLSDKFKWDGSAVRWDGRNEYDVLADRVKYALRMVIRRAAGIKVETE